MPAEPRPRGSAAAGSGQACGKGKCCDPARSQRVVKLPGYLVILFETASCEKPFVPLFLHLPAMAALQNTRVSWCFSCDGPYCLWHPGHIWILVVIFCLLFFWLFSFICKWLCSTSLQRNQGSSHQKCPHKVCCSQLFLRKWLGSPLLPVLALFC